MVAGSCVCASSPVIKPGDTTEPLVVRGGGGGGQKRGNDDDYDNDGKMFFSHFLKTLCSGNDSKCLVVVCVRGRMCM